MIRWEFATVIRKVFESVHYPWSGTEVYNYWQRLQVLLNGVQLL